MTEIKTARQIGAIVRETRTQKGLTQQQLADIADVSRGFIARLEKGAATALYPEKLLAVLNALDLSLLISTSSQECSPIPRQARQTLQSPAVMEQLASATASADFLKTSPLVAPREQHNGNGDQK